MLEALRVTRSEVQWTQLIRAACSDRSIASGFVRAVLGTAGTEHGRRLLDAVPAELVCRAEVPAVDREGRDLGRLDLVFEDPGGDFVLICEAKLHADYGSEQLERYTRAVEAHPAIHKGLVAVTTHQPFTGEAAVSEGESWIGSVRWSRLYDRLRAIDGVDASATALWRDMLDILRRQGDFGPMDLDTDLVRAWARYREARDALGEVLDAIARPTEELLRERGLAAALIVRGKHGNKAVFPWASRPHLKYSVGKRGHEERLWVQFHAGGGEPYFSVEARYQHPRERPDSPALHAATSALETKRFSNGNDGQGYFWAYIANIDDVISGADSAALAMEVIQTAVASLVSSGIFAALDGLCPSTPSTQLDQPDDPD